MDETIVVAKCALIFRHKAESLVELVCTKIARKGINHNGDDVGIGKAKLECASHHRLAIPPAEIFGGPNPNVYGAQIWFDLAPIVRRLGAGIDDLERTDWSSSKFCDQILIIWRDQSQLVGPIGVPEGFGLMRIITGSCDYMWLLIPAIEQGYIVQCHGTKNDSGIDGGGHDRFPELGIFGSDERSGRNPLKAVDLQEGSTSNVFCLAHRARSFAFGQSPEAPRTGELLMTAHACSRHIGDLEAWL
jgi:hypothetical protein